MVDDMEIYFSSNMQYVVSMHIEDNEVIIGVSPGDGI